MKELVNVNIKNEDGRLLVSSRDIAVGLEKEHKDVLRKIREVLNEREFSPVEYKDEKGEVRPEYLLDKNAFILLVMNYTGYNDFKRAYIKRFDEMEKQLSLKYPQSYPEALRQLACEVEQKKLMQKQRDEGAWPHWTSREPNKMHVYKKLTRGKGYARCKSSFDHFRADKRTATAMNTASQKSKEVARLQRELDKSREFASIKAVEIKLKQKFNWKPLRNYCTSHELEMPKTFDSNYGSVRTYPAKAWKEIYNIELKDLF